MAISDRDNIGMVDNQTVYNMRIQSLAKSSLGNGVIMATVAATGLKVMQREAGANMSVDVQLGSCIIDGTTYTEAADVNLEVAAADATDPRIDLIVYDQSVGNPAIVAGTPAEYPQVPDVTDDADIPLALVYVAAQETSITNAEITDVRSGIKSSVTVNSDVDYEFVSIWKLPIRITGGDSDGSYFSTLSTTYETAGYAYSCPLPTNPFGGTTLVARLCALVSIDDGASTATVCLLSDGVAVGETTTQSTDPTNVMSAELSTGAGNNLTDNSTNAFRLKTSGVGTGEAAKLYSAWVEFYAKY